MAGARAAGLPLALPGADRSPPNPSGRRLRLTDALVQRLRFAEDSAYRVADAEQVGLFVIVGRKTRSFTVQADLRQNRRRARTLKRVLGRAPDLSVRSARAAARQFLGVVARGQDSGRGPRGGALTLRETWQL